MSYSEFDDGQFTAFHRRLLRVKGSNEQVKFLNVVKDSDSFIAYIEEHIASTNGILVEQFTGPLTEFSFKEMTSDQERTVFTTWADVPPRVACRVSFWGKVTLAARGKSPGNNARPPT